MSAHPAMRSGVIWLLRSMTVLLACAILAAVGLWAASQSVLGRIYPLQPESVRAAGLEAVAEGRRLSKLYGCTSCHGPELRGNRFNDDPVMVHNYAPNLTVLTSRYSDEQFAQAIRQGVHPIEARALWGMPSSVFATISDAELASVLAFMRSIEPGGAPTPDENTGLYTRLIIVRNAVRPSDPFEKRAMRPAPEQVAWALRRPPANAGPQHMKGRHIAATVCSECHGSDLRGNANEGGPDLVIAAAYERKDFHQMIRTGVPPGGRDLGIMSATARDDLRVFTNDEIDALHAYLQARAQTAG